MEIEFEKSVLLISKKVISEFEEIANKKGITISQPILKKENSHSFNSEIEITFSDDNGIFDVLEFHIYNQDKSKIELSEIESWLKINIEQILNSVN